MRRFMFFFFSSRRRHTRLQGDWSSDVCSSDLGSPRASPNRRNGSHNGVSSPLRAKRMVSSNTMPKTGSRHWPYSRSHSRSEEHTSELQSPCNLVCRLLLEKKKKKPKNV